MKFKDLLNQESLNTFKSTITDDEKALFKDAVGKVKKIKQDTVQTYNKSGNDLFLKSSKNSTKKTYDLRQKAQFTFSDEYEPHLSESGPVKYVRDGVDSYAAKRLRRGEYQPDLVLDLHGLDQHTAKSEIAALLYDCEKEHAQCVCIVHGLGGRILKNKVPHWLVQHPDVMAFHQAPLEWGGNGALLVLVELKDKFIKD